MYKIGDKVSWHSINADYTGEVVGFHGPFAVVRIDGNGKSILIQNEPIKTEKK